MVYPLIATHKIGNGKITIITKVFLKRNDQEKYELHVIKKYSNEDKCMIKLGSYELHPIEMNSKFERWLQTLITWKKQTIRGVKENMKLFKSLHLISTFKSFNGGIIELQ
jgi:hypothetical protein